MQANKEIHQNLSLNGRAESRHIQGTDLSKPYSNKAAIDTRSRQSALLAPGVSEIVIPSFGEISLELILPMVAHLSRQSDERWLTWIGETQLSKTKSVHHQFSADCTRTISSRSDEETLWLMWEAANNGTSAFVVATLNNPSTVMTKQRALLEQACNKGKSRILILKPAHH